MTCAKTQGFLAKKKIETTELVDAKKKLKLEDAVALLAGMDELIVAKGKRVERLDLRAGRPDRATVARLMLGPTGNLRAPPLRVGRRILVGFDEGVYKSVLG